MVAIAPRPWGYQRAAYLSNNDSRHLYLVDANGRKIAALWGKQDEKEYNAELIIRLVNEAQL